MRSAMAQDSRRRLDILMISFWDFQNEGMQVTLRTPLYLAERGHRVTFMVHSETTSKPSRQTVEQDSLDVRRFELPLKSLNRFGFLRRFRQLVLFAGACIWAAAGIYRKGRRPDLIYAAEADAVLIGSLLRRIYRVPLVTRFYGVSRIAASFDFSKGRLTQRGMRHMFSRWALTRRAELSIITDDGSRGREIMSALNPRVQNIRFWRNGVDPALISKSEINRLKADLGLGRRRFVLLTLCRLDRWKGVDLALEALKRVRECGLTDAVLVVAGSGPEANALRSLARTLGVESSVIFAGGISHDRVYSYYGLADVFLSLYRYSNVGNPLFEALNCGCCLLTVDTGATEDVIKDGKNGRLLHAGENQDELVRNVGAAILELKRCPALRAKLREGARSYARSNLWTWDDRLRAEMDAILEVVDGKTETGGKPNIRRGGRLDKSSARHLD